VTVVFGYGFTLAGFKTPVVFVVGLVTT